jgi:hypothetical protein
MNKRIIPALMSGLLILASCFSPIVALQPVYETKKTQYINWNKIVRHTINTPLALVTFSAFSFGTAFIPAGTLIWVLGNMCLVMNHNSAQMDPDTSVIEKYLFEVETSRMLLAGMASHATGCHYHNYYTLKSLKTALDSVK